jgi:hypothetical protein
MFFSALTALNRKDGKLVILASVAYASAGGNTAKVAEAYRKLVAGTPAAAEQRAKYSRCMLMLDNQVRNTHEFPDPVVQEARQKAAVSDAAARQLEAARQKLQAAATQGRKSLEEFQAAVDQARAAGVPIDESEIQALLGQRESEPELKTEEQESKEPNKQEEKSEAEGSKTE